MMDLIGRQAALESAVEGADEWDGGWNPEREGYIREHIEKLPTVKAIPFEVLQEIRDEIAQNGNSDMNAGTVVSIIDRKIKEYEDER